MTAPAQSDDNSAAGFYAEHPGLLTLITSDPRLGGTHQPNAGPVPNGFAMACAQQLGITDLYLADPPIAARTEAIGNTPAAASSSMALEQWRQCGPNRFALLNRLDDTVQSWRDQSGHALLYAQAHGSSPGRTNRPLKLTSFRNGNGNDFGSLDDGGGVMSSAGSAATWAPFERVFDADLFTAWYLQQPGLQNQAFAGLYGASKTTEIGAANTEFARAATSRMQFAVCSLQFANAIWTLNWSAGGPGLDSSTAAFTHRELASPYLNAPPDLHYVASASFDFETGWFTAQLNVARDAHWFETAFEVALIVGVGTTTSITSGLIHDN